MPLREFVRASAPRPAADKLFWFSDFLISGPATNDTKAEAATSRPWRPWSNWRSRSSTWLAPNVDAPNTGRHPKPCIWEHDLTRETDGAVKPTKGKFHSLGLNQIARPPGANALESTLLKCQKMKLLAFKIEAFLHFESRFLHFSIKFMLFGQFLGLRMGFLVDFVI